MRSYLPSLSLLKNLTTTAANVTATSAASSFGGFMGHGVGGAYGAAIARTAAGYYVPSMVSTGGVFGAAKAFAWNNVAKKSAVEALGHKGFQYGAMAGATAGGFMGAVAVQLGTMAAQKGISYGYNKYNNYQEHKAISQQYMDLANLTGSYDVFQSSSVEPDYVHVSTAPRLVRG